MIKERQYRRKRLWTRPHMLLHNMFRGWPFLIWLGAAGAVVWLYSGSVHYGQLTGVVETGASEVASPETARLVSVEVVPGQAVQPGDVLAHMDTTAVDAAIAADEAAARFRLETAARDDAAALRSLQQMDADAADAQADMADTALNAARDAARLEELKRELARREGLLATRMIREEDVALLRADVADLAKAADSYPTVIAAHQTRASRAAAGRQDVLGWLGVATGETATAAIERRAREREATVAEQVRRRASEREVYVLRSAMTGTVSRIYHEPGTMVVAGDPIIRVARAHSARIVGFLPESQLLALRIGDRVTAWRKSISGERVHAVVEGISPDVQTLPARLGAFQATVPRGRRVTMRVEDGTELVPGETVHVELDRGRWIDALLQFLQGGAESSGVTAALETGDREP